MKCRTFLKQLKSGNRKDSRNIYKCGRSVNTGRYICCLVLLRMRSSFSKQLSIQSLLSFKLTISSAYFCVNNSGYIQCTQNKLCITRESCLFYKSLEYPFWRCFDVCFQYPLETPLGHWCLFELLIVTSRWEHVENEA